MSVRVLSFFAVLFCLMTPGCVRPKVPPGTGTLTPDLGSGGNQIFTATYIRRGIGIRTASILINSAVDGAHACWVEYNTHNDSFSAIRNDSGAGFLRLRNDDGTHFLEPIPADSGEEQSNGQCTISARGFSATHSGDSLTVKFPLRFSAAFRGERHVYLLASTDYAHSGWQQRGTWRVP